MSDLRNDIIKFSPREEQTRVNDFIFKIKKEKPDVKYFLLNLPTGVGKAQPLYSKILTPSGWVKFGDIKEGDELITPSGKIS
jgi:hypothetical protein